MRRSLRLYTVHRVHMAWHAREVYRTLGRVLICAPVETGERDRERVVDVVVQPQVSVQEHVRGTTCW